MVIAGQLLKELRSTLDVSQLQLAVAIGVTPGAISQIETGKTSPKRETAQKIDDALKAGGQVMRIFGFSEPVRGLDPEVLTQLDVRYAPMEMAESGLATMERLADDLEKLRKRVARLEADAKSPRQKRPASG